MKDIYNYSLLSHNTFGIDAKCHRYIEFSNEKELIDIVKNKLFSTDYPLLLLGGGSNLLLTRDYPGTVIHSGILGKVLIDYGSYALLRCGSGEIWDDIVSFSIDNDWHGMENLSLIPGEVGASAVQNIGAYGAEVKDLIETVEVIEISTGRQLTFANSDCKYAYRQSRFKGDWRDKYIITYVTYRLSKSFYPIIDYGNLHSSLLANGIAHPSPHQLRQAIIDVRQSKLPDPKIEGNAGSFFMNPIVSIDKYKQLLKYNNLMPHYIIDTNHIKIPAGWLIEQCGWKGKVLGRVGVHPKQALVLVNKGGATGKDVLELCDAIRKDVFERFNIDLHPEVNIK